MSTDTKNSIEKKDISFIDYSTIPIGIKLSPDEITARDKKRWERDLAVFQKEVSSGKPTGETPSEEKTTKLCKLIGCTKKPVGDGLFCSRNHAMECCNRYFCEDGIERTCSFRREEGSIFCIFCKLKV